MTKANDHPAPQEEREPETWWWSQRDTAFFCEGDRRMSPTNMANWTTELEDRVAILDRELAQAERDLEACRKALEDDRGELMDLIRDLVSVDGDDCYFDHRGGCQAHGYLTLGPGQLCPHAEAKQRLAEWEALTAGQHQ